MNRVLSSLRRDAIGTVLRQRTKPLKRSEIRTNQIQQICADLLATHIHAKGAGLAAPQIGHNLPILAANLEFDSLSDTLKHSLQISSYNQSNNQLNNQSDDEFDTTVPILMINPTIKLCTVEKSSMFEGCLSIPDWLGRIYRPIGIEITFLDWRTFSEYSLRLSDFDARVVQHEIDHLNGKLIIDHITQGKEENDWISLEKYKLKLEQEEEEF